MERALFIFRRDLRLQDNSGLIAALKKADELLLCFIFTPEQIESNPYRGDRSLQFMIESLEDLEKEILSHSGRLYLFYGKPHEVVEKCIRSLKIKGVFVNHDYTPYSLQRDANIQKVCHEYSIAFHAEHDLLLHPFEETLKKDGKPYTVFTPFYRHASKFDVPKPKTVPTSKKYFSQPIDFAEGVSLYEKVLKKRVQQAPGGRQEGLKILKKLKDFSTYSQERDIPSLNKTTHLSPHLKFTTCSVREVYHAIESDLGRDSPLIRSLVWRDFFTGIAFHFPHVFGGPFKKNIKNTVWKEDDKSFEVWCRGETGFPIVDAGMRELNQTGVMHNRVRMIVASFLIKDLHLNWQWGEKYFAQHLIDYDPAVNNGNWQWSAGTGCDAQPYFRIFNPWTQSKKFDPEALYIKKWVPELQAVSPKAIHEGSLKKNYSLSKTYPHPMLDHSTEARIALTLYKQEKQ